MRGPLALAFLLATFPLCAQEPLLDFAITPAAGQLDRGTVVIPIELSIPAGELRFVEDGDGLASAFSVRSVAGDRTTVLDASSRVQAPRGSTPAGVLTRRYELRVERGTTSVDVVVRDENAQIEGKRSVTVDGKEALVDNAAADARAADASWREVLVQAEREKKPVVVFFTASPCSRCDTFASASVPHPAIQRRLPAVVFVTLPAQAGQAAGWWQSADPGVAFFDRRGILRARWPMIPDTTDFGIILDSVSAVAADFERAARLAESDEPDAAELAVASGLGRMGRIADARDALALACASARAETRDGATVMSAILDANDGRWQEALAVLEPIARSAATANIGADAWMAIGAIRRATGSAAEAAQAFSAAAELFDDSPRAAEAKKALASLRAGRVPEAVRVLPLPQQVVRGRQVVRTHVGSPAVARVVFSLDGREAARVARPPFSATLDFGEVPERHVIHAVAFDRKGQEIGRHERVVNSAGETFRLHLLTPREGDAGGAVQVSMDVRVPALQRVRRVVVTWNDAERAVLQAPPWISTVTIAEGEIGVLGAVAELADGRTSEDAVLLNARGPMGRADVQLVELPMTIASRRGTVEISGMSPEIAAGRIVVREGGKVRRVASIGTAAETPLTIGLLIDVSASMQASLLDVQEAAIGFLEATLGPRDRAFVITFDTRARIVQPATSDVSQLRRQIMTLRPDGLTAIHDAMVLGLLQFEGIKGRRAMVVFTDGLDLTSEYSAADVRELARRVYVPIHVIASTPGVAARLRSTDPSRNAAPRKEPGHEELARIARSTGGSSQALDDLGQLGHVYARIEASLRAQILAFVRTDPGTRENEWRPISVEMKGGDLEVFAPEGYYAAW
jgi:VWFA-related protein